VNHLVDLLHVTGMWTGWLFARRLWVSKLHKFKNDFFTVLEKVQATTDLIPLDLVIRDECGMAQTLWCSLTAEIPIELIKAINHWRMEPSSETNNPSLDMPDVYTLLTSILPATLCFTLGL
jgi:hypothetical protein